LSEFVLKKIEGLFLKYGIKSVTMDDIARELGKSKKTLYEYCTNKEDLVQQVVGNRLHQIQAKVRTIQAEQPNAIKSWIAITNYQVQFLQEFNSSVIFDLKKYYAQGWQQFERHRQEFVFNSIKENLERGINEGLYRPNLKPEIIAFHQIHKIEPFATPSAFKERNLEINEVMEELTKYHLFGVASETGRQLLHKIYDYEH
jgi:AcrR family transcriptional regulator